MEIRREQAVEAILSAAEEVFASEGLEGARMGAIAERSGMAVGSLYNHFEGRRELLRALVRIRREELLARIDGALAQAGSFEEGLRRFLDEILDHWLRHGRLLAVLMGSEYAGSLSGPRGRAIVDELHQRAAALARRGLQEGVLRPEGSELHGAILFGMIRGVAREVSDAAGAAAAAEQVVRVFLEGTGKAR